MRKIVSLVGLLLICFSACDPQKEPIDASVTMEPMVTDDPKLAILIDSEYNHWLATKYGYKAWMPTEKDLGIVWEVLDKAIKADEFHFIKQPIQKNIKQLYRQYIPYVNNNGDRIIEINALCMLMKLPPNPESGATEWTEPDWKNEYIAVHDGGFCYWRITINLDTKAYEDFMVNGGA